MRTTAPAARQKKWLELIRQQEQSQLSVSAFCRQHGFSDQSFYNWRKRLAADDPVRFAWWMPTRRREPTASRRWN